MAAGRVQELLAVVLAVRAVVELLFFALGSVAALLVYFVRGWWQWRLDQRRRRKGIDHVRRL